MRLSPLVGKKISFKFLSLILQRDISLLQSSSVYQKINLINNKKYQITILKNDISYQKIEEQLQHPSIQKKILDLENIFKNKVYADIPNALWERKKHIVTHPHEKDFLEKQIPKKARPIQMNSELLEFCKKEIQSLLDKRLIREGIEFPFCRILIVPNSFELV